ncbi:ABC transporter permease [Actinopolymorpha alba]|uniref:ABC transporter permease n=1 Tax=Actinopolymorpha alba TaxID=533267 RepID=UPI0003775EB9|nr:ABC transporter permease [Actinopolymorpha alba]
MIDVLAAEWWKLKTVRSTGWILAIVAGCVGLACLLAWYAVVTWDGLSAERRGEFGLAPLPAITVELTSMCLAVLGVLAVTSEYSSGLIRTTLTVVPKRRSVLFAKACVVTVVAFLIGLVAVCATSLVGRLIIDGRPIRGQWSTTFSEELPLLLAMSLVVTVFALVGLGLGTLMRSAAGAIATVVALWYVVPMIAVNLPAPWNARIGSLMLGSLAGQLAGTGNDNSVYGAELSPLGALSVMLGYVVLALGAGAIRLSRKDV